MSSQFFIYNEALGYLGERLLASLTENREPRRVLDSYWNDTVLYCLDQAYWRFALRTVQIDALTTIIPQFGYNFAFSYPNDWIKTRVISTSPDLDPPLLQYRDENNLIYANATPIYQSYVSVDPDFGMNIGAWPAHFVEYVSIRLAQKGCMRIANDKDLWKELKTDEKVARRVAKSETAMDDPPGMPPVPFWVRARRGAFGPGGLWFGSGGSGGTGEN